jgi:alpha-amylase
MTGESVQFAPDIDHDNPGVQNDVVKFAEYLQHDMGFQGIRLDFAKGFSAGIAKMYMERFGHPWFVSELWHGDLNTCHDYIKATKGKIAVFDFPLFYVLKRCMASNDFTELAPGGDKLAGVLGEDPKRAVTFVDNHDTSQLPDVGGPFGNDRQIVRGYAFVLTHPGTPTVFWPHVFGPNNPDHMAKSILAMCKLRNEAGVHSTSRLEVKAARNDLYAALIHGNHKRVAVKMGSSDWHPGKPFPEAPTIFGQEFAIWTS